MFVIVFEVIKDLEYMDKLEILLEKMLSEDLNNYLLSFEIEENNSILAISSLYFQTFLLTFLQILHSQSKDPIIAERILSLIEKIHNKCFENFVKICKEKVFDLILGFPETEKTVFELKEALEKTNLVLSVNY